MSIEQAMIVGPSGKTAQVNSRNELHVDIKSDALRANIDGRAFSALVDVTSAGAAEDFFYLKNKDTRDLIIYKIEGWVDDAQQEISILLGATDEGTGNGDTITPYSLNSGSGTANVDCVSDATDLAITGGVPVNLLKFHATVLTLGLWDFPGGLILTSGSRLHMSAALAGLINLNVFFYFAA